MSKTTNSSRAPRGHGRAWHPMGGFAYRPGEAIISFAEDPIQVIMGSIILAAIVILFILGGICIWPFMFSRACEGGSFAAGSVFGKMIILGGISGAIGAAVSVYLSWFFEWEDQRRLSFFKIWLIVYTVEMLASLLLMPVMGVDMLQVAQPDGWTNILGMLVHGVMGMLISTVPSFAASFLGFCANRLWFLTHSHLL